MENTYKVPQENLIVLYTNSYENNFGGSHLYKMKAGDDVVTYFSSRDLGFEIGTVISKFIATVKSHEVYEDIKQTVVTRGKIAPREMTKEEKRAINKLKKVLKTIEYSGETYLAHKCLHDLITNIKDSGFSNLSLRESI